MSPDYFDNFSIVNNDNFLKKAEWDTITAGRIKK